MVRKKALALSIVEYFDLISECLALMIQTLGNQILIGFEKVYAIALGGQVLQLHEKLPWLTLSTCFHRQSQALHQHSNRSLPRASIFLQQKCEVYLLQKKGRASSWVDWKVTVKPPGQAKEKPFCDVPREFIQWLWTLMIRGVTIDRVFEDWVFAPALCLKV